jgi:hypothetical protein
VCQVWAGGEVDKFLRQLSLLYEDARLVKPPSSRSNSAEIFVYARGLKSSNNNAANQQDDNKDDNITKSQLVHSKSTEPKILSREQTPVKWSFTGDIIRQ